MSALSTQVGGDHYSKLAIQPVEYITRNGLGFVEGSVIKYVTRHKAKHGAEDIKKAIHFLNLLLELEYGENGEDVKVDKCKAQFIGRKGHTDNLAEVIDHAGRICRANFDFWMSAWKTTPCKYCKIAFGQALQVLEDAKK